MVIRLDFQQVHKTERKKEEKQTKRDLHNNSTDQFTYTMYLPIR